MINLHLKQTVLTALCVTLFSSVLWVRGEDTAPQQLQPKDDSLYQYSTISALLVGVFDGEMTFGELKEHGDLGLGTFNGVDGEMLQLDGVFYRIRVDGFAYEVPDEEKTPFANVTFFDSDITMQVQQEMSYEELEAWIDQQLPTGNLFYALRISGLFTYVKTRSVPKQEPPYPPLAEVVREQSEFEFSQQRGTMVGFRGPAYVEGINVPGYHLHFLTVDKQRGGHVLALTTNELIVEIDVIHGFNMVLPNSPEFYQADLHSGDLDEVEKPNRVSGFELF